MRRITPFSTLLLQIISLGLLAACGSNPTSHTSSDTKKKALNLIVMGGNSSCSSTVTSPTPIGSGVQMRASQIVSEVAPDKYGVINFVWTCYTNSDPTIYLIDSNAPSTVKSMNAPSFFYYLNQFVSATHANSDYESVTTYLAGHSYGGWLAMQTVIQTDFLLDGLYTIDPISRTTCSFGRPFGCTSAPTDIGTNQRQLIADKTATWHNFYQTRTFYLHSSVIEQADRNTLLPVSHTDIDSDRRVWRDLQSNLMQLFKLVLKS